MASARTIVCHRVPRTGPPPVFADWDDYCARVCGLLRVADAPDIGSIWWDVRPAPLLGTVEIRCFDTQSSLADAAALIALTHCLVRHEARRHDPWQPMPELLAEASWRAVRDGLDAEISLGGPVRPIREAAREAVAICAAEAPQLGCAAALNGVERILEEGNGAIRQRRAFAAGGMRGLLEHLASETSG
jgi:carboxylate-amine ligase